MKLELKTVVHTEVFWMPCLRISALSSRQWKTLEGLKAGVLYDPM